MRAALLLLVLAGCSGSKSAQHLRPEAVAPPEAWAGVSRIAVLPPDNWTPNLGLEYITWYRALVHEVLRAKGYECVPLADVNRFLVRNKFTVVGEVAMYTPEQLGLEFRCDAVLYWNITTESPTLAFLLQKSDGTVLWSSGDAAFRRDYKMHPRAGGTDQEMAVTVTEILGKLPGRP